MNDDNDTRKRLAERIASKFYEDGLGLEQWEYPDGDGEAKCFKGIGRWEFIQTIEPLIAAELVLARRRIEELDKACKELFMEAYDCTVESVLDGLAQVERGEYYTLKGGSLVPSSIMAAILAERANHQSEGGA